MDETSNPLLPTAYDLAWTASFGLILLLAIVALVSLIRRAPGMTTLAAGLWAAIVILVPVLGPVAWFGVGNRARTAER
ncbi:PLDc N-terminal domain-containing protein [Microbacterium album]|uniref:PLDc N-terminal domain-containing protein n=1 Tax=Microbacterium album TaxID=2053191 RepID=UPI00166F0EBD|nr:PLDc N-terminal domain-containing protein [Microbacterium album]